MVQRGNAELPPRGLLDYISRVDDLLVIVVRLLQGLSPSLTTPTRTIAPSRRYEIPGGGVQRLETSSTIYVALVEWKIPTERIGVLRFVEVDSEHFATTRFKLEVAGKVFFTDLRLNSSMSLEFPDVELAPGSAVTLSVRATSGSIVALGDIVGKEKTF